MRKNHWLILVLVAWCVSFAGGYAISTRTGSEPGYFSAVEAAGYGGGAEEKIEGLTDEIQDYYKSLQDVDD